jgi:membrane-associated phospholipid phosphatase
MRPLPLRRRALLRAAAFGVAFTVPVAVLAYVVRAQVDVVLRLDQRAIVAATDITRAHPELRHLLIVWQEMFQAKWLNLAATALCVWVWRRHGLATRALWAFLTIMAAWAIQLGAKGLVQRARPVVQHAVEHAPGSSFPSGHAMNTAAVAVTLTLLVWPLLGPRGRVVVPVVAGTCVLLTGVDRVMLGVHFPSDVVAGFALGTALAGASYLGYSGWSAVAPDQES